MRLNSECLLQHIADSYLLVPTGEAAARFHGVVKLNETAAFIVRQLQNDTDAGAIVDAMAAEYEGTREQFARSVAYTLTQLRSIGAINE